MEIGKLFLIIGAVLLVLGLLFMLFPNIGFPPKLPGDILIKRGNFTLYFPIVTSILLSIILTIILNFFLRK